MLQHVILASGDMALVVNGHVVMTADPECDDVRVVEQLAEDLAVALNWPLDRIERPTPPEGWTWEDVLNPDAAAPPPGHPEPEWLANLSVGQSAFWVDPDEGVSSGEWRVMRIDSESGRVEDADTIVALTNEAGGVSEVLPHEIWSAEPRVIYAPSEDGYWSNDDGWGGFETATLFGPREEVSMPLSAASDAGWRGYCDALASSGVDAVVEHVDSIFSEREFKADDADSVRSAVQDSASLLRVSLSEDGIAAACERLLSPPEAGWQPSL